MWAIYRCKVTPKNLPNETDSVQKITVSHTYIAFWGVLEHFHQANDGNIAHYHHMFFKKFWTVLPHNAFY